jgi:hypothetical protein
MLPAPARIAAIPIPKSRECWNPAVPPPPVAGAAVTNGLGVAEGLGVGLADGVGVGVPVGLTDELGVGVPVELADEVTVGLAVPGENGGGDAEDAAPEQPETVAEAKMVKAAQPATAKLALRPVPRMVVRIFTASPHACGRWRHVSGSAGGHKGKAYRRHRRGMACSSLEFRLGDYSALGKTRKTDSTGGGDGAPGAAHAGQLRTPQ